MSHNQTGGAAALFLLVLTGILLVGGLAFGLPQYGVYQQTLSGKAKLSEAQFSRQIAVAEAQAKLESAKQLADAEVERARGVAEANKIIGDSLKGNREYLAYLYITGIQEGSEKGNRTIYIPTEGGVPVPTFGLDR